MDIQNSKALCYIKPVVHQAQYCLRYSTAALQSLGVKDLNAFKWRYEGLNCGFPPPQTKQVFYY